MADSFRIVLKDVKHHDTFECRELDLPVGSTYPIGRASKSVTKPHLMPSANNAFIDSPVISREHAVLSATLTNGTPHVYITDRGSMHGTMINGRKLQPDTPERLSPGDMLQFGIDVNRNEDFFVARKYLFEAQLTRPYSLGFAVPDAESEEDDLETHQRGGSQHNPLVLDDDSDAASNANGAADDDEDVTMVQEVIQSEPAAPEHPDGAREDLLAYQAASSELPDNYSDAEESVQYSIDEEASAADDTESVASSQDQASSEPEVADSDDDDELSPLSVSEVTDLPAKVADPSPESSYVSSAVPKSRNAFTLDEEDDVAHLPLGRDIFGQTISRHPWASSAAPPLPPRPNQDCTESRHGFATNITEVDEREWSDFAHAPIQSMGTNFADRSSLFSALPPPPPPRSFTDFQDYYAGLPLIGGDLNPARQAHSLQTPLPMPASDVGASTPQPVRRTKVSIEEIVEEQPPTPESINNMKRKADALEEEQTAVDKDLPIVLPASAVTSKETVLDISAIQTAATIAQRPKKQPKSILAKVGLTAKYLGLGTAGAFAAITALSTLPDTFFM
ncbi:hypothetical protein NX059_011841 [Plenodomus lindquistii]|nr:hypothetical protein NX059_011841 [Plenodomus lindquistii]